MSTCKLLLAPFFLLLNWQVIAQNIPIPGQVIDIQHQHETLNATDRSLIWAEDFSNGFNGEWVSSGIALWEYRGPFTSPSSESGTRGSCLFGSQEFGAPINSVTYSNGFVIFDSNYWDDSVGPCGNFGSGTTPAPHFSSLTSPAINLSTNENVGLRFTQYARNLNAEFKVQVSVDNSTWIDVHSTDLAANQETERDDLVEINVSSIADLQEDFRIKFIFEGTYYFWMIDDVELYDLAEYDLELKDPTYGDFNINDPDHDTGYEFMEYSILPVAMLQQLKLAATAVNKGYQNQSSVSINAKVIQLGEPEIELHSETSELVPLNANSSVELRMGTYQTIANIADYEVRYELSSAGITDETPQDNSGLRTFRIDELVLARDHRALESIFIPSPSYENNLQELGNVFLIDQDGMPLHSISTALFLGSELGSSITAKIYRFEIDEEITVDFLAESQAVTITESMLNSLLEENMTTLYFDAPINLETGVYFVSIVNTGGANQAYVGLSGLAEEFTSFVYYPDSEEWFTIPGIAMLRMNFGEIVAVEESPEIKVEIYPNPAVNRFKIEVDFTSTLRIYDMSGRMVGSAIQLIPGLNEVNCSQFDSGPYVFRIENLKIHSEYSKIVIVE